MFARALREITASRDEIVRRAAAARDYAERHFDVGSFAARFDDALHRVHAG